MTRQVLDVTAAPGVSTHEIEVSIPDFIAWSNANPYLYKVNVRAKAQDADRADTADFYTGFQRVAIDGGGYFTLNGRRILLKCANITVQQSYGDKLFENTELYQNLRFQRRPHRRRTGVRRHAGLLR